MVKLQCVLIVVLLAVLALPLRSSAVATYYREGDMWLYEVTEYSDSLVYTGHWNASYQGITTKLIDGELQDVHFFLSIWELHVTGTFENATVTGYEILTERQYTDLDDYDTILSEYNQSMTWHLLYPPDVYVDMEGWIYNVSVYSPPGGTGEDPTYISVGDEWTNTYPIEYTTTEYDGFSTIQYSGSLERTVHYTVTGIEAVTVPEGTFSCTVIHEEYDDGGATRWISNKVGSDVKIVAYYDSGEEFTAELTYYSFGARSDRPGSTTALAASAIVAVVAAALVMFLFLRKRKAEFQAKQAEGVYDPSRPPVSPPGQIL
jgi:hypothetical protein